MVLKRPFVYNAGMEHTFRMLEEIIDSFILNNPEAWQAFLIEREQVKRNLANEKFGLGKGKTGLRRSAMFPNDKKGQNLLNDGLIKIEPRLLKDEVLWNAFLKRFPIFLVTNKH